MHRRAFFRAAGVLSAGCAFPSSELLADRAPSTGWRTFEVTTSVEVRNPSGRTCLWVPAALARETPYQKTYRNPKTLGCGLGDIRFMLESRNSGTRVWAF